MRKGIDPFGGSGVSGFHPNLLSGLALAGANRDAKPGEDDGILTALEVAELDLGSVELVTLSACENRAGRRSRRRGRPGSAAGLPGRREGTVVSSLWSVDDEELRGSWLDFYDNLWQKKLPKLEALRRTQFVDA